MEVSLSPGSIVLSGYVFTMASWDASLPPLLYIMSPYIHPLRMYIHSTLLCLHPSLICHAHTHYYYECSLSDGAGGGHSFDFLDISADVIYLVMQMKGRGSPTTDETPRGISVHILCTGRRHWLCWPPVIQCR